MRNDRIRRLSDRARILVLAAVIVGTLDMVLATGFWALRGVAPMRILQSVASGLLGRAAFGGGIGTALFGLLLHFSIAFLMVLAYDLAALRLRWLVLRPWIGGPLYGGLLYIVMNGIVVPLSAAAAARPSPEWFAASVLSHVLLVGLPCALFVRSAQVPVAEIGGVMPGGV